MIVWVLIVKIILGGPMGTTKMAPYFAFANRPDCENAMSQLPTGTKADCVAFAADIVEPTDEKVP